MPLTATIIAITPLPDSIPGSANAEETVGFTFPSVYGGQDIDFNAEFSFVESDEFSSTTYPVVEITPLVDLSDKGVSISTAYTNTNTVNISGNIFNVFFGEYYRFLLRDASVKNLPPVNNEDWVTLVGWGRPSSNIAELKYEFEVKYNTAPTTTVTVISTISQEVFYNFNSGISTFRTLLSQGEF
jgi:hypothetical protein